MEAAIHKEDVYCTGLRLVSEERDGKAWLGARLLSRRILGCEHVSPLPAPTQS